MVFHSMNVFFVQDPNSLSGKIIVRLGIGFSINYGPPMKKQVKVSQKL